MTVVGSHTSTVARNMRDFRSVYETHYGFVWSTVRRFGVPPGAVDDAVQDAFLTAFRRWDDLPDGLSRAWLYGIAKRVCSNVRRTEHRRLRKIEAFRATPPRQTSLEGRFEASTLLEQFLSGLDDSERELFVLGAVEGLTGKELSAALQQRPGALYARLARLRRRFKTLAGGVDTCPVADRPPRSKVAAGWLAIAPVLGPSTLAKSGFGLLLVVGVTATLGLGAAQRLSQPSGDASSGLVEVPIPAVAPTAVASVAAAVAPAVVPSTLDEPGVRPEVSQARALARPASRSARPSSRRRGASVPRMATEDVVKAEAALVRSIRAAAQREDSAAVLEMADEYEETFSDGVLADAVAVLRVEALCDQGQIVEAQREAKDALRTRPGSVVGRRLVNACPARRRKPRPSGHSSE